MSCGAVAASLGGQSVVPAAGAFWVGSPVVIPPDGGLGGRLAGGVVSREERLAGREGPLVREVEMMWAEDRLGTAGGLPEELARLWPLTPAVPSISQGGSAGSCKELRRLIIPGFQGCMSIPGWSGRWRRLRF
jgi:hypothetical protein